MHKIGITGQTGFIGKHLYNVLGLYPQEFTLIPFERAYFDDPVLRDAFVSQCDVIVHLAAVNRHHDPKLIYTTNTGLALALVESLKATNSKAHVIFSSSTQEERDNQYGKSKRDSREILAGWAKENGGTFTGMIIPNVFGPFGHPFYNSVVATFCHQLANNQEPKIDVDGKLGLIYVGELVQIILDNIRTAAGSDQLHVSPTHETKVSDILSLLKRYKNDYQLKGILPAISNTFERNLFNTYRCYMDMRRHFPIKFNLHTDPRGSFVEVARLNMGGQVSFSTTVPGVTRGNHFHIRKIERFAVIKGKALIQLRQIGTSEILDFYLSGDEPAYVDMPIWYTHNIKNIGDEDLYTIFWINESFDPADPDTFMEIV